MYNGYNCFGKAKIITSLIRTAVFSALLLCRCCFFLRSAFVWLFPSFNFFPFNPIHYLGPLCPLSSRDKQSRPLTTDMWILSSQRSFLSSPGMQRAGKYLEPGFSLWEQRTEDRNQLPYACCVLVGLYSRMGDLFTEFHWMWYYPEVTERAELEKIWKQW